MENKNISIQCGASVLKDIVRLCNVIGSASLYCAIMKDGSILFQSIDEPCWMMIEVLISNSNEEIEVIQENIKENFIIPVDYLSECIGFCDGMTTLTYWPKRQSFTLESKEREAVRILRPARCEDERILITPIGRWISSVTVDSKRLKLILGRLSKIENVVAFQFIVDDGIQEDMNRLHGLVISDVSRDTIICPILISESITKEKLGFFNVKWAHSVLKNKGKVELSMADIKDRQDSPLRIGYNNGNVKTTIHIAPRKSEPTDTVDVEINVVD